MGQTSSKGNQWTMDDVWKFYEKVEPDWYLGKGAFAKVFKVRRQYHQPNNPLYHTGKGDVCAIKVVDLQHPEIEIPHETKQLLLSNSIKEAIIWRTLDHPNIVKFYGFHCGPSLLVMELELADKDLQTFFENRDTPLQEITKKTWCMHLLLGLHALHQQDIIHRDLSARNVLLFGEGEKATLKITDFGLAREDYLQRPPADYDAHAHLHCPDYAPPEMVILKKGEKGPPRDKLTDIWSMGVVFYFMDQLKLPFDSATSWGTSANIEKYVHGELNIFPKADGENEAGSLLLLAQRMMTPDRGRRPQNIDEILGEKWLKVPQISTQKSISGDTATFSSSNREAIGIDLGTSTCCIAVLRHGKAEVIVNDEGGRTMPSYVSFVSTERLVGEKAAKKTLHNTANTVFDIKRFNGHHFSDPFIQENIKSSWPFRVIDSDGQPKIEVQHSGQTKSFYPIEICSLLLRKLKETADASLEHEVKAAVVSIPALYNCFQREAIQNAAYLAGLEVLQLVKSPLAAALAYGFDNKKIEDERNILIFDIGGGSCSVAVIKVTGDVFDVRSIAGNNDLGGEDFDDRMVRHFASELKTKKRIDILDNKRALRRLRTACERAKRSLSIGHQAAVEVDSICNSVDFSSHISRSCFEDINKDLFLATLEPVKKALADAEVDKADVHKIVLVGGSTRIPKIQALLRDFFGGRELNRSVDPDEAVAQGAAILAAKLSNEQVGGFQLFDIAPYTIGIDIPGREEMKVIIKRSTAVPAKTTVTFTTEVDNQTTIEAKVYEGEQPLCKDNTCIGSFEITNVPRSPKGTPHFEVTFDFDANGEVDVSAIEKATGAETKLTINGNKDRLTKVDVEQLLQSAERYRDEDKRQRERAQAKTRLEAYIAEIQKTIESDKLRLKINDADRAEISRRFKDVSHWIDATPQAKKEEMEHKHSELERFCDPIVRKACQKLIGI